LVVAIQAQLGEGVVVRSDDVDGNEVKGKAWLAVTSESKFSFAAVFNDDGTLAGCAIGDADA